eukprot:TCALIF_11168-PA protein Name:"Similar to uzip Protein unzipped (Drosophila melanogaster)" AED:0.09 eAED:0.09 QI:0/0/0.5/0.5/1/1/2/1441/488
MMPSGDSSEAKNFCSIWKSTSNQEVFYRHPTVIRHGQSSVCRGYYKNQMVQGSTDVQGRCAVGFFKELHRLEQYQVLVDGTSMARLEWFKWDIFTKLPIGLVAYTEDKTYVARYQDPETQKWHFGDLDPRRGLSGDIAVYFPDSRAMKYATKGEILMEIEPVRYMLQDIQYHMQRAKVHNQPLHLGSRILSKDRDEPADYDDDGQGGESENKGGSMSHAWSKIRSVIAYNASYSYYWGQLEGMIKALPSSASSFTHDKKINFNWGLPLKYERHRILEVPANLQAGTSIQISASAQETTTELTFTGQLVYIYADGTNKRRKVNGTYIETLLTDVRTEYGRPYFTNNGTYAPTTTTTTTVSPTTLRVTTTPDIPAQMGSAWPQHSIPSGSYVLSTTFRPRRTTEPLPTSTNPLLRFYPTVAEASPSSDGNQGMQSDEANSQRSLAPGGGRRRPITESLSSHAPIANHLSCSVMTTMSIHILLLTLSGRTQ